MTDLNLSLQELEIEAAQRALCEEQRVAFVPAQVFVNSGFALETEGKLPINGLRHPVTTDTTGWYIWCGEEFSDEQDFFKPVHTIHLYEAYPALKRLLGLPPGYRFLSAGEYQDIWLDASLLSIE
jgi:hypothetical protein